jgi:hypothetical protein
MSEAILIACVLFLVYLSQCFASAPLDTVVFLLDDRGRGRLLRRWWQTGPSGRRVILLNPFLPHVSAVYTHRIPFVVRLDSNGRLQALEPLAPDAPASAAALSFEEPREITACSKEVLVGDRKFASLSTESSAREVAALLNKLQNAGRSDRVELLEKYFREKFAAQPIADQLERFSRNTGFLATACFALFVFIFALGPAVIFRLGLARTWFPLLLYLIFAVASILWAFARAYRRVYCREKGWPLQQLLAMALSPFAAIRASDLLAAELLENSHPVAVARRLLPEEDFRDFAGAELRKVRYLHGDVFLARVFEEFLARHAVDPEPLLRAPQRESLSAQTYCPVCLTQYLISGGVCRDCDGTQLVAFPP